MPGNLLIVDDEPQIIQVVKGILQDEGFEVTTAPDGETALKLAAEEPRTWCFWTSTCRASMVWRCSSELKKRHTLAAGDHDLRLRFGGKRRQGHPPGGL